MKDDFLVELSHLGLIARLKRLSDNMLYSIRNLYQLKELDLEPNWHLVFLLLKEHKQRTLTEIADAFQLSQPAIFKIINKMEKKGYVEIYKDKVDNRKRQIQLSQKALAALPLFEQIWAAGQASIEEMLKEDEVFMEILEKLELQLKTKEFKDRVLSHLS